MGQSVSIYFSDSLLDWIDAQAKKEKRSRSNQIAKVIEDVKDGKIASVNPEILKEIETRKTRLPPSART